MNCDTKGTTAKTYIWKIYLERNRSNSNILLQNHHLYSLASGCLKCNLEYITFNRNLVWELIHGNTTLMQKVLHSIQGLKACVCYFYISPKEIPLKIIENAFSFTFFTINIFKFLYFPFFLVQRFSGTLKLEWLWITY